MDDFDVVEPVFQRVFADGVLPIFRIRGGACAPDPVKWHYGLMDIVPLTRDRFADLAALFEQGGDPRWCWCMWFRMRGLDWSRSTGADNRAGLEAIADHDPSPGLVAYQDGAAVGWVSLGPRVDFDRLAHSRVLAPVDDRPVWSIVCFVVGRRSRGQGIAGALLDVAIRYAADHGATMLEAYPVDVAPGARIPSANAYHGTLSMFERAGFRVVATRRANKATAPRPIVRLELPGRGGSLGADPE